MFYLRSKSLVNASINTLTLTDVCSCVEDKSLAPRYEEDNSVNRPCNVSIKSVVSKASESTHDMIKTKDKNNELDNLKENETLKNKLTSRDADVTKLNNDASVKNAELMEIIKKLKQANKEKDSDMTNLKKEFGDKILRVELENRKLLNQIHAFNGNIRVFCRVRPLPDGKDIPIDHINFPDPEYKLLVIEKQEFKFDKVFTDKATQDQIFTEISPLVQSALDGYDVCIFAYGQSGSGKTYTMEGTNGTNKGIIPRAFEQIFTQIEQLRTNGWKYDFTFSFLEIYNKTIIDLLNVQKDVKLEIKLCEKNNNKVHVPKLTVVTNPQQENVKNLLKNASKNRHKGKNNFNLDSSRSHSVLTLKFKGAHTETISKGTLQLVDLAGSEKPINDGNTELYKEAVAINSSLLNLHSVFVKKLNTGKDSTCRGHNLVYLLKNALAGNSKTLMFVNVSPELEFNKETLCSLRFAEKANRYNMGPVKKNVSK